MICTTQILIQMMEVLLIPKVLIRGQSLLAILLQFCAYSRRPMFYNEDKSLPVYQWTSSQQHYSIEELGKILLAGIVPESNICHVQPMSVYHNVSFVINLNSLDDPNRQGASIAYVSI